MISWMALTRAADRADDALAAFMQSMPPQYAAVFGEGDARSHLAIVSARGTALAHAAPWKTCADKVVATCIVTDDRPSLLSVIATALVMHRLDVRGAQIFSRERTSGRREAVDFFWLRRPLAARASPITSHDMSQVALTLSELLVAPHRPPRVEPTQAVEGESSVRVQTRVFFDVRALQHGHYVLVVETPDGPGLLLAITRALVGRGVETVSSEVQTIDGIARDRFMLASVDRIALAPERLADLQRAVLKSIRELRSQFTR